MSVNCRPQSIGRSSPLAGALPLRWGKCSLPADTPSWAVSALLTCQVHGDKASTETVFGNLVKKSHRQRQETDSVNSWVSVLEKFYSVLQELRHMCTYTGTE